MLVIGTFDLATKTLSKYTQTCAKVKENGETDAWKLKKERAMRRDAMSCIEGGGEIKE